MKNDVRNYIKENNKTIDTQLGRVTELSPIGEGGNGLVYAGVFLEKKVAIKILGEIDKESKINRFKAEYFNVSMLPQNPFTVSMYSFDTVTINDESYPLIMMKMYESSCKNLKIATVDELKKFVNFLLESVNFLHNNGIIHRDLKPENILIDECTDYKITDFGISSFDRYIYAEFNRTKKGERLANYDFSAPECFLKEAITAETMDIYSIGQLIQWSVFGSTNKGTNRRRLNVSDLNKSDADNKYLIMLDGVVDVCLRQNFEERFQTIDEVYKFFNEYENRQRRIDPFDEMGKLHEMITEVYPESYERAIFIDNEKSISNILNNIDASQFSNNSFWFTYGFGNNNIKRFRYRGSRWLTIENTELFIKGIWLSLSSNIYDDLIMLVVENNPEKIEPFVIEGENYFSVVELDDKILVPEKSTQSGNVRYGDEVLQLKNHKVTYRNRYNTEKYYFLGTQWSNVLHSNSDEVLHEFQSQTVNHETFLNLKKLIHHNKDNEVRMRL